MKRKIIATILIATLFIFTLNGCANSNAMNEQVAKMQEEIDKQASEMQEEIEKQASEMQEEINKQASEMLNEINGKNQEYEKTDLSIESEAELESQTNESNSDQYNTDQDNTDQYKSEMDLLSKTTELFEQVYLPYATREKSFVFDAVKTFVNTLKYEIEITEPTEDDLGIIKVIDTNGDYVSFCFTPINEVEIIMIVSYYHVETNSEVSLDNYSPDGSPQYDKLKTHKIGESNEDVSSTDEQRIFLFN